MQLEGKRGPGRPKRTCESGDLPCMQLASYLERSLLVWMMLLHVNLNAYDDDENTERVSFTITGQ